MFTLALLLACTPPDDTGSKETGSTSDTSETGETGETGDSGETTWCEGDGDGIITSDELVFDPSLGVIATYTVNEPGTLVEVDLSSWDHSGDQEEDQSWPIQMKALDGAWFADSFPAATYYVPLDATGETVGIYRDAGDQLQLLGLASVAEGETLLVYQEPAVIFDLPMQVGRSWSTTTEAVGTYGGDEYPVDYGVYGVVSLQHTYTMHVADAGTVQVPMGGFEGALKIRVDQEMAAENSYYGTVESISTVAWFYVAECAGLVARIRGPSGASDPDFALASEYLRLGL